MPLPDKGRFFSYLGFVLWGDIAETTMYRRPDKRVVFFSKTYPDKPPSAKQIVDRAKFSAAAATWKSLSAPQRLQWRRAAARSSLCMTGYNLFVAATILPDPLALATIARQTRTTLDLTP
jgi:hypothetical protein